MTEADVIVAVRESLGSNGWATPASYRLIEEGLALFPGSAQLWILRGDLIQLGDADIQYTLNDALLSYRAALEHEPYNAEAHESIGHFLDAVNDSPAKAEAYFRKAIALGGGRSAEEGLAQVLEQLAAGRADENTG